MRACTAQPLRPIVSRRGARCAALVCTVAALVLGGCLGESEDALPDGGLAGDGRGDACDG